MGCTYTGTEGGLSSAIVLKGTLAFQFSQTTQRNAASYLSHWAIAEHSLTSFFQWGLYCFVLLISLCNFIKIHLWINNELPVTRCPGQPKSSHVTTARMRLCSFRHDQHNKGRAADTLEKNWNTAVRIMAHSCFIKSNASYFWSKLSTAFIKEADLCMQQRNHFQHN